MDEPVKRLLLTEEPYTDESFIGYLWRLAELNEIPTIRWIIGLVSPLKYVAFIEKYNFEDRLDIASLSSITGIDAAKLRELLYVQTLYESKEDRYCLNFFNQSIHQDLVIGEPTKVCPICLIENNYCRKIWELLFITACPIHKCLLLSECPLCNQRLKIERPKITLCKCRFDLRKSEVKLLKNRELRLTNYFYRAFNLPGGKSRSKLDYPLNTLSPNRLIKLLNFMLTHFAKVADFSGYLIMRNIGNEKTHKYLNSAVRVFDNWAVNYHKFIKSWSARHNRHYISERSFPTEKYRLIPAYNKYQPFYFVLRSYFKKEHYPFLYSEFMKFRYKLRA